MSQKLPSFSPSGSLASILLIHICGGAIGASCVFSTLKLGLLVERTTKPEVIS